MDNRRIGVSVFLQLPATVLTWIVVFAARKGATVLRTNRVLFVQDSQYGDRHRCADRGLG
jgi:hypothetical protein